MLPAARLSDKTSHDGVIAGPSNPAVLIEGIPAATVGDLHRCEQPDTLSHPKESFFNIGSNSVFIAGKPALRVSDRAGCGAEIISGAFTVLIG
jgi:uncharacterized Zn-binding protein involved in type VI secretion